MQKHSDHFEEQFQAGKLLLYGPVMAPDYRIPASRNRTCLQFPRPGAVETSDLHALPPHWILEELEVPSHEGQ
jgi:hypothetical protein